jgi:FkbM family methyltransferase
MKREIGWFFPDGEKHLPEWMVRANQRRHDVLQYQFKKYEAALAFTKQRRLAIDVGANIGLWSKNMVEDFEILHAFEPVPKYIECWRQNMLGEVNAELHEFALGTKADIVSLTNVTPNSFGDTIIAPKGDKNIATDIEMRSLDSFGLKSVDFIKIDCEGYEVNVLLGSEHTIRRDKPVVIVEQKPGNGLQFGFGDQDAVELLKDWGATLRTEISGDFILSW